MRVGLESPKEGLLSPGNVNRFDLEVSLEYLANDGASSHSALATVIYKGNDSDFRILKGGEGCIPGVGWPFTGFA